MRRVSLGIALVIASVVAVVAWRRCHEANPVTSEAPETAGRGGSALRTSDRLDTPAPGSAGQHVRRLDATERRRLREQLAAALERRSKSAKTSESAAGSEPPELVLQLEDASPELSQMLSDAVPALAECYREHAGSGGRRNVTAMMTMTSDPDLGMVIDTERITDADGTALDATLETCMRDTIDALALPPLAKPGKLPLQYTFKLE